MPAILDEKLGRREPCTPFLRKPSTFSFRLRVRNDIRTPWYKSRNWSIMEYSYPKLK